MSYAPPVPPPQPMPQLPATSPPPSDMPSSAIAYASAAASARGWLALENRFYERTTLHAPLSWPLTASSLAESLLAAAPYGGPVAVIGDGGWGLSAALTVYSAAGSTLCEYDWLRPSQGGTPARALALGWTEDDVVMVVYEDGYMVRVQLAAAAVESARIGPLIAVTPVEGGGKDGSPERLFDACVLPKGQVVVRTVDGMLYCTGADDVSLLLPGEPVVPPEKMLQEGRIMCGTIVATALNDSARTTDVEVLVVGEGGSLTRANSSADVQVEGNHIYERLALSPDGKFVAASLASGHVIVRNISTLTEVVRVLIPAHLVPECADPCTPVPDGVAWVGPDAVAITFNATVLLVGPGGEVISVDLDATPAYSPLVLQTEKDGLRVITIETCEFVQMVPDVVEAVFLSQDTPSNKLMRAARPKLTEYEAVLGENDLTSIKRYELLSELRESANLGAAAKGCVAAAYLVWNASEQKTLLNAAVYGQMFSIALKNEPHELSTERPPSTPLTSSGLRALRRRGGRGDEESLDAGVPLAIATLRVLTTVRTSEVAIPMTKVHLDAISFDGLVSRISRYGLHDVATRLAAFCGLSPNVCLQGWARERFSAKEPDDELARQIIGHFEETRTAFFSGGVRVEHCPPPYKRTAHDAFKFGRSRLAEYLLLRETNYAVKVSLYLEMNRESLALRAAILSKDNELVMDVIDQLREKKNLKELARLFRGLPPAMTHRVTDMMVVYLREMGEAVEAQTLLAEVGRFREAAMQAVMDANSVSDPRMRLTALERTAAQISRWRHRKSNTFELQSLHQAIASSRLAVDLEKRNGIQPGSLQKESSTQLLSVAACVKDPGKRRDALSRVRRDLKIPESRFFWVVLESLAEEGAMDAVEALSTSAGHGRPPPIGLMPFVDVCLRHKQEGEAMKYAARIADLRDRARALARCGAGKEAADIASKLRNAQLMEEVTALVARHSAGITLPPPPQTSPSQRMPL